MIRAAVPEHRVKQIDPSGGVGVTPIGQALLKNAPHPNAAKLWMEWSLSEEGQTLLAPQGYAVGGPLLQDVATGARGRPGGRGPFTRIGVVLRRASLYTECDGAV